MSRNNSFPCKTSAHSPTGAGAGPHFKIKTRVNTRLESASARKQRSQLVIAFGASVPNAERETERHRKQLEYQPSRGAVLVRVAQGLLNNEQFIKFAIGSPNMNSHSGRKTLLIPIHACCSDILIISDRRVWQNSQQSLQVGVWSIHHGFGFAGMVLAATVKDKGDPACHQCDERQRGHHNQSRMGCKSDQQHVPRESESIKRNTCLPARSAR